MAKPAEIAVQIVTAAKKWGFDLAIDNNLLVVSKKFTPGDMDAFVDCDTTYYSVLGLLPRTSPGSDWGTDGGGVGGYSAVKHGYFVMKRSGGSKRVLSALKKMI